MMTDSVKLMERRQYSKRQENEKTLLVDDLHLLFLHNRWCIIMSKISIVFFNIMTKIILDVFILIYWYRFLLLWTSKPARILEFTMFIPQAFEAIASSSGGVQTLIQHHNQDLLFEKKGEDENVLSCHSWYTWLMCNLWVGKKLVFTNVLS